MDSLFTTRDPVAHTNMRKPVVSKFSMTSIRTLEPLTDQCTEIFARAMSDLEGRAVDLGAWLQWYAFDVIGAITFRHRFGFMEEQRDVKNMIAGIDALLPYVGIVGQIPALHPWLAGNEKLIRLLARIPFLDIPDPLIIMVQARHEPVG
jgi:cytochrome P450